MIRKIETADYPRLVEIWESAVRHTHDFLAEEDVLYYKERLPSYFPHVALRGFEQDGNLVGFIGVHEDNIENAVCPQRLSWQRHRKAIGASCHARIACVQSRCQRAERAGGRVL